MSLNVQDIVPLMQEFSGYEIWVSPQGIKKPKLRLFGVLW